MGGLLSRSKANNPVLDGLRASMCVWMILFHSHFWQNYFMPRRDMLQLGTLPLMQGLVLPGYMAVDVFFVLTGYLLASSLFRKHMAARAKLGVDTEPAASTAAATSRDAQRELDDLDAMPLVPVNLRSWVYRRAMRVLPGVCLAAFLWCFVLFGKGSMPIDTIKSEPTHRLIRNHFQDATHLPHNCEMAWTNILFVNQVAPFGGCMGYTWTLAIQFHFYLLLPVIWNWGGPKRLRAFCKWGVIGSLLIRIFAAFHMRRVLPFSDELGYFAFFWYSFTPNRVAPLLYGVLAAHEVVVNKVQARLKASPLLVWLGWFVSVVCMWGARALDFETTMSEPLMDLPSMATAVLIHPGGILIGACITFMVLTIDHAVGPIGTLFHKVFSLSFWAPIAELSFFAYLLHPMVMQKAYATVFYPIETTGTAFVKYFAFNLVVTLAASMVLHAAIDTPLQKLLSRRTSSQPGRAKRFVQACSCYTYFIVIALSLVVHIAMVVLLGQWAPNEESYNGLGPNATAEQLLASSGGALNITL